MGQAELDFSYTGPKAEIAEQARSGVGGAGAQVNWNQRGIAAAYGRPGIWLWRRTHIPTRIPTLRPFGPTLHPRRTTPNVERQRRSP